MLIEAVIDKNEHNKETINYINKALTLGVPIRNHG